MTDLPMCEVMSLEGETLLGVLAVLSFTPRELERMGVVFNRPPQSWIDDYWEAFDRGGAEGDED